MRPEDKKYQQLDSKIPKIAQTMIGTQLALQPNPQKLADKGRPDSLAGSQQERGSPHKGNQGKPSLLIVAEAIRARG